MAALRIALLAAALCAGSCSAYEWQKGRTDDTSGWQVDIADTPWMAQIVFTEAIKRKGAMCVGSILDETHVLTSASCFPPRKAIMENPGMYMFVNVGSKDFNKGDGVTPIEAIAVSDKHDIAVVTLAVPLTFSKEVQPIKIVDEGFNVKDYSPVFGGGWCSILETKEVSFRKFGMTKAPQYLCNGEEALFCTENTLGNHCKGDAGSGVWAARTVTKSLFSVSLGNKLENEEAPLLGVLSSMVQAERPHYVDLLNKDVRAFLEEQGVIKKKKSFFG